MSFTLKKLSVCWWIMLLSAAAQANKEVGNGGDVVVCRTNQNAILSIELLDYYEAEQLRQIGIYIDAPAKQLVSQEAVIAGVLKTLERIKALNPRRYEKYVGYLNGFFTESLWISGKVLTDVPDSDHMFLPLGCQIEQIAIQKQPVYREDSRYIINNDLWSVLPLRDAIGLVLHEIIYREMILAGFNNSTPVRYFNSLIAGDRLGKLKLDQYIKLLATIPLPDFDYQGLTMALCFPGDTDGQFSPCNEVKEPGFTDGLVTTGFILPISAPWQEGRHQFWNWNDNVIPVAGNIQFFSRQDAGKVSSITVGDGVRIHTDFGQITALDWDLDPKCAKYWQCDISVTDNIHAMNFYPSGHLKSIYSKDFIATQVDPILSYLAQGWLWFYDSGAIYSCVLDSPIRFDSTQYSLLLSGKVEFNEKREIVFAEQIEEGRVFLPNQDQVITQVTSYARNADFSLSFTTQKGLEAEFFGNPIEFGPGRFEIRLADQKLITFQVKSPVELKKPIAMFPNHLSVIGAGLGNDDYAELRWINLGHESYMESADGGNFYYPANSHIWLTKSGKVQSCDLLRVDAEPATPCRLQ